MKKNRIITALLFITLTSTIKLIPFTTLEGLDRYVKSYPEEPPMDNKDPLNPDYTTFLHSTVPRFFSNLIHRIGIGSSSSWNIYQFKILLQKITNDHKRKGLTQNKVVHIRCTPETSIYVWSNVHGGLHSMVRSLLFLQEQKIIDDSLKIIQPNTYFIFDGDYIDYSAYDLESLYVMLLLLNQNPDTIFYIRGKHESDRFWHNFTLRTALQIRAERLSHDLIPLDSLVNDFFNTLPYAAYFSIQGNPSQVIRVSSLGRDNQKINEQAMGNLFAKDITTPVTYYDISSKKKSGSPIDVKVIIKSIDWLQDQHISAGFELLEQDMGSTAWTILSTPIKLNQVYFGLFNDSFALIELGKTIDESTITLYQNNIQTNDGFKKIKTYNIVTGISEEDPVYLQKRKDDIFVGSSMSLELGVPSLGQAVKDGLLININSINQAGGINGHLIRAIIYNDDYIPYLARYNINKLISEGITTILLPVGSPTVSSYIDYIKSQKIIVLFPVTGGDIFRSPDLKGIINWRASYADEVTVLINYVIKEFKSHKFALFYQDDAYGQGPAETARKILKSKQIDTWIDIPYTRASTNFKEQAQKIKIAQPDAIGLFSTAQATQELIRELGVETLGNVQMFGLSFLGEKSFRQFIKAQGLTVLFASVVPNPYTSQLEIVKQYRAAVTTDRYFYDVSSLEAYIATDIFADILKKIDEPITMEKIIAQLESLHHYPFKGLTLTFNPKKRDLSQPIWIEIGNKREWIKYEIS